MEFFISIVKSTELNILNNVAGFWTFKRTYDLFCFLPCPYWTIIIDNKLSPLQLHAEAQASKHPSSSGFLSCGIMDILG